MFFHQILPAIGLAIWFVAPMYHYAMRRDWGEVIGAGFGFIFFALALHDGGFLR